MTTFEQFYQDENNSEQEHPCPKGKDCALNKGAVKCYHCGRNWPPDETWNKET